MPGVAGLLLAAGAGRRMGRPKALVRLDGEALVRRGARVLAEAGLAPTVVVLGAAHDEAAAELAGPAGAGSVRVGRPHVVVADDWDEGMGASLRAGLAALRDLAGRSGVEAGGRAGAIDAIDAVAVMLVDTPGIGAVALRRVAERAVTGRGSGVGSGREAGRGPAALARGAFAGVPGHPVVLGRDHWDAVAAGAHGDRGARDHLRGHPDLVLVEIGDVADPADVDTPADLDHR